MIATEWNARSNKCTAGADLRAPDFLDYTEEKGIGLLGHAFDVLGTMVRNLTDWTPTSFDGYACGVATADAGELVQRFFQDRAATERFATDQAPSVVITAPAADATVPETFTVSVTARDDRAVTGVELLVDAVQQATFAVHEPRSVVQSSVRVTLSPGSHTLEAVAYDDAAPAAHSAGSVPVAVTVDPAGDSCAAGPLTPEGLRSAGADYTSVALTWDLVPTDGCPATSYQVARGGTVIGETTATEHTVTGLRSGVSNDYAVPAVDAQGRVSPWSTTVRVSTTPDDLAPLAPPGLSVQSSYRVQAVDRRGNASAAVSSNQVRTPRSADRVRLTSPTNLRVTALASTSVTLTWRAASDSGGSGLAGYHVYRGGTWIGDGVGTRFTDSGLVPQTSYTYTVVAYDRAGNTSPGAARRTVVTSG